MFIKLKVNQHIGSALACTINQGNPVAAVLGILHVGLHFLCISYITYGKLECVDIMSNTTDKIFQVKISYHNVLLNINFEKMKSQT